jgi:hypothetical protein
MHYTALHNYSAAAGIPPSPAQRAPAMASFTAISAASGELMVPENAGVVIQAKSGINAIRVSGTATTTAGVTGPGTTSNQIQFYSNDTIVGAFDQNGLYFPDAKSNILSVGTLGSILTNNIANIGNNNLNLIASSPIANQNPGIIFYVQNPTGVNGGLGNIAAGYINNGGMTLNASFNLNVNSALLANNGLTAFGYYRNTSNTNFNTILLQGPDCPNQNGGQFTYAGDITLKASDLTWAHRSFGAALFLQGGRSDFGGINHGDIFLQTAGTTRLQVTSVGQVRIGSQTGNPTRALLHVEGNGGTWTGSSGYFVSAGSTVLNYVGTAGWGAVSIFATNDIVCGGGIGAYSDGRIKKNIKTVDNSLDMINKINLCSYNFIDNVKRGDVLEYGIIAQEVNEVCPDVIKLSTEYIPNIYRITDSIIVSDDTIQLILPVNHDLEIGDSVKIILKDKEQTAKVLSIENQNTFTVKKWDNFELIDKVFVYGKEVDDFKVIDKIQLSLLSLGGVKDLHTLIKIQQQELTEFKNQLLSAQSDITELKTQLKLILEKI